ncbi:MAG: hypothetical protein H6834_15535 [Planctomycetes bacterium]|nr:hypothetical protein [Planctomycetota bacterium]
MLHVSSRLGWVSIVLAFSASSVAQTVTQIGAPTVAMNYVDMDAVGPVGPTTVAAINAAGVPSAATIANITLTPSTAANPGVYNTTPSCIRALGLDYPGGTVLSLIDSPAGQFTSFNAQIDLMGSSTEIGIGIGDWVSTMVLEFYSQGVLQTSFTTTAYSTCDRKYFQMTGGTFDRVDVRASTTGGNWVITELDIEQGCRGTVTRNGAGCQDNTGTQLAVNVTGCPDINDTMNVVLRGGAGNTFPMFFLTGLSDTFLGPILLPIDLTPFGAPGCSAYTSQEMLLGPFPSTAGSGGFSAMIPNQAVLVGGTLYTQGWQVIPGANALNVVSSNYVTITIG